MTRAVVTIFEPDAVLRGSSIEVTQSHTHRGRSYASVACVRAVPVRPANSNWPATATRPANVIYQGGTRGARLMGGGRIRAGAYIKDEHGSIQREPV